VQQIPRLAPAVNDLALLAQVAYAARCALRVEAHLRHYYLQSPDPAWAAAVVRATGLAVRFARGECPGREELDTAACAAFRIAEETDFPPWHLTALAAGHAAVAAREACAVPAPADTPFAIALAEECGRQVRLRVEAAWQAAGAVGNVREALRRDLEILARLSLESYCDPSGDGPLGSLVLSA
jgi:hypothetical protein